MSEQKGILGLDIGGANVKAVRLDRDANGTASARTASAPLEVWRDPSLLAGELAVLGRKLDAETCSHAALTMTAELCDSFATKREGVNYICGAVHEAFPGLTTFALDVTTGKWDRLDRVADHPLHFAANNWMASALHAAQAHPDALLIDVGSTTTDIIPLVGGEVAARGRTDTERLDHGELVYCGALRSNPNTLVRTVPVRGSLCRVADERFSFMADVHLLLGNISEADYTCATADGRGTGLEASRMRLARLVCADGEMLSLDDVVCMARAVYEAQLLGVTRAALQVLSGLPADKRPGLVLAAGSGAFVAAEAAARLDMEAVYYPGDPKRRQEVVLPALAAAHLLSREVWK
ncbi:MAG: hydantoinase/oxoprolinase family protein [Pseudodesulfovibrio sp.]|jgi:probable H4MPT-linked C1 transfer pathway protein|uniref:hydantoinase/oxoprolinase family protein n=1 Tax=Pseudodesulfovibrio sp. TaxID=2035812 RepID=UPI003D0D0F8E